jgi:hypothetical protein
VRFDVSDNEDEQGEEPVDDGLNVGELVGQLEVVLKCFVVGAFSPVSSDFVLLLSNHRHHLVFDDDDGKMMTMMMIVVVM